MKQHRQYQGSTAKKILFSVFTIVLLAGLTEAMLRVSGLYNDDKLVLKRSTRDGHCQYQINEAIGQRYLRQRISGKNVQMPLIFPDTFDCIKPENEVRIFVLGGSSTQGYPYPYIVAFPAQLEILLNHRYSEKSFKVVNLGVTALNSFALMDFTRELLDYEPDLFVVYAGHNEFYGAYGSGSAVTSISRNRIFTRSLMALQKTAVYTNIQKASSIIADIVTTDDSKVGLIEIMARKQAIPWESALVDETMTQFQKNLSNICETAVKNNVPVVVCTVASNVEGLSPMGSDDIESDAFKSMKAKGLKFLANDNFEGAKSMADSLMHDFPDNAWGYFLQGKLENNTASGAGCDSLKKARDLDGLRFRAPGRLNSIIREMPNIFDGQVVMVDVEPVFDQHALQGCPGYDLFVDHVHPTAFGHHLIARAIAKRMAEARLVPDSADTKDPGHDWIDWEICREIAGYTDVEEMMTLMQVFTLYRRYPLQTLPEASEQIEKTGLEIKNIFNRMSPVMQMTYERWVKENYTFDLHYEAGKMYLENGDCALAQKEFQIALKAHPDNPSITELLAKATACLAESGGSGQ